MATVLRSASLPVEPSRGQPAAPETEAAEPVTGGGDLRGTKGAEIVGRWLTIPRGATVSEIVFDHYGQYSTLALDLIQELNPDIRDIDRVRPGQLLWLPPLNLDALLRRQADGSYRLIVTSQPGVRAARGVVETVRAHGYAAAVTTREVASSQVLYRVEIDKLNTRAAAIRAWETFRRLESFDLKPEVPGSR